MLLLPSEAMPSRLEKLTCASLALHYAPNASNNVPEPTRCWLVPNIAFHAELACAQHVAFLQLLGTTCMHTCTCCKTVLGRWQALARYSYQLPKRSGPSLGLLLSFFFNAASN